MNIFFELLERDRNEANPNGVSKSHGIKTDYRAWPPSEVYDRF